MATGLLPLGDERKDSESGDKPSTTYRIDFENKCLAGWIDGVEALKQSILLRLSTERFEHLIYSWDYGCGLTTLLRESRESLKSGLETRIRRSLLLDDRIERVDDFTLTMQGDELYIRFRVTSQNVSFETEVNLKR